MVNSNIYNLSLFCSKKSKATQTTHTYCATLTNLLMSNLFKCQFGHYFPSELVSYLSVIKKQKHIFWSRRVYWNNTWAIWDNSKRIAFMESWMLFMKLKPDQHPNQNPLHHHFLLRAPLSLFRWSTCLSLLAALPHHFSQCIASAASLLSAHTPPSLPLSNFVWF